MSGFDFNENVMRFGTAVTREILDRLGSPDKKLEIIHIAGTNGKGSTAEFFTSVLVSAGLKTGTFTSPAVYRYGDQFRIDGKELDAVVREKYFSQAVEISKDLNPTPFEVQTAGIIYAFACENCRYAVIECGMGGLTDATNAISRKRLAVITSVFLEHTAYLGGTIKEICAQKAGIIRDCPVIVNAYQCEEARGYFGSVGVTFADGVICKDGGFIYKGKAFTLSAPGELQPYNAATAIEGARLLGIDERHIYDGIKNARPCGRVECMRCGDTDYILDGAHNPAAFVQLRRMLESTAGKKIIIYGCLSDKDSDGNLKMLAGTADGIIAVECKSPRAPALKDIEKVCKKYFTETQTAGGVCDALCMADARTVAVCGSFTLLKEAKEWIEKRQ